MILVEFTTCDGHVFLETFKNVNKTKNPQYKPGKDLEYIENYFINGYEVKEEEFNRILDRIKSCTRITIL